MSEPVTVPSLCQSCKFAEWERTSNGRRHPNGSGRCLFQIPDSPLPKWADSRAYGRDKPPITTLREYFTQREGNPYISWLDYHRTEPRPCATHEPKP